MPDFTQILVLVFRVRMGRLLQFFSPTKAKGIKTADLVLWKFATPSSSAEIVHPSPQCVPFLVITRNIAVTVLLPERLQIANMLFPWDLDAMHFPDPDRKFDFR